MRIPRTVVAVVFLLFFSTIVAAQSESKTKQIIGELTRKAEAIKSYEVDTKTETEAMGQKVVSQGTMKFKQPDKMKMATVTNMMGGMKQEIFMNGKMMWTYMPMMKMATKVDMSKIRSEMPGQSDTAAPMNMAKPFQGLPEDTIKFIEKKKVDDHEVYVFESSPETFSQLPGQSSVPMAPQKMVLMLYADSGLPHKVLMYSKEGNLMVEQTYTNYKLNVSIPDSEFQFTPPKDAQVMDMTEAMINMIEQGKKAGETEPSQPQTGEPAPSK